MIVLGPQADWCARECSLRPENNLAIRSPNRILGRDRETPPCWDCVAPPTGRINSPSANLIDVGHGRGHESGQATRQVPRTQLPNPARLDLNDVPSPAAAEKTPRHSIVRLTRRGTISTRLGVMRFGILQARRAD